MTLQTPSPQYTQLIQNNIAYYQKMVDKQVNNVLYGEQQNIQRAILMGIQVADTFVLATDLLQTLEHFVEIWGAWRTWIPLWQLALEKQTGSSERRQIQTQLAFFHRMNGDYEKSSVLLQDALAHLDPNEQEAWFGKAHFHLGYSLFHLKQYKEAKENAQIALTKFKNNPDIARGGAAPAQNLLGLIALYTGNIESAIQQFAAAYQGWQQSGQQEDALLLGKLNEALAYEANQQFDKAMDCYQQVAPYVENENRLLPKVRVYLNMGTLYLSQGKWVDAQRTYLQLDRNILFQQGYIDPYARLITNLGHVSMELGNFETALSYLKEAKSIWQQLEDAVMLANALDSLGDTFLQLQQLANAHGCYKEGLMLTQQHPDDYIAQQLQKTLSQKIANL